MLNDDARSVRRARTKSSRAFEPAGRDARERPAMVIAAAPCGRVRGSVTEPLGIGFGAATPAGQK